MIIKSDKWWKGYFIFWPMTCPLCYFVFVQFSQVTAWVLTLLLATEIILTWIVTQHTLIMDEKGCTVLLWKYKRTYKWNDFAIIRIEKCIDDNYNEFAFFSLYLNRKARIKRPILYCKYCHPFTSFFVFFIPPEAKRLGSRMPETCAVDKGEFLDKMKEWGVQIKGI